jgi:hypothetical protein
MTDESRRQVHFGLVADALFQGRVVPFLGAGVNVADREMQSLGDSGSPRCPPTAAELAIELAREFRFPVDLFCNLHDCPFPSKGLDLTRVAQHSVDLLDEGPLYDKIHALLAQDWSPTTVHRFLAALTSLPRLSVSPYDQHLLIVSTNYDDLMEQAFTAVGQAFDLVVYRPGNDRSSASRWGRFWHRAPDGSMRPITSANADEYEFCQHRPVILKLHGTIQRDDRRHEAFVITEDQYIEYLADEPLERLLPAVLLAKLCDHHLLFLGYSLKDWNLRVFLRRLKGRSLSRFRSWAVLLLKNDAEQHFWLKNGVELVSMALDTYIKDLTTALASRRASPEV